jgi:hypothetical protein
MELAFKWGNRMQHVVYVRESVDANPVWTAPLPQNTNNKVTPLRKNPKETAAWRKKARYFVTQDPLKSVTL